MAPKRRTSTDSPVGKLAETLWLSSEIATCGVGMVGETGIAEGFFDRSIIFLISFAKMGLCVEEEEEEGVGFQEEREERNVL